MFVQDEKKTELWPGNMFNISNQYKAFFLYVLQKVCDNFIEMKN